MAAPFHREEIRMRQYCEDCKRSYNDEWHSTVCPHKGIGFCAVCDCAICVCSEGMAGDWERSSNNRSREKS
jgi:hypothetical protein